MNRKNRKKRLKRLNAQRKANIRVALSASFKHTVHTAITKDLEYHLEVLETEAIFDLHPKLEERIKYIKAVLEKRASSKTWNQRPSKIRVRCPW